jgi:RHS repeat-associated protein
MKRNQTLTHSLALAVMMASNAWAALPAAMPKFMDANELADWRAEMAEQSAVKDAAQANADALAADQSFYTGKPYLPATGSYAFKYRSYQPELARWTSEDPSGFPDGANNGIYVNNNVSNCYDPTGLATKPINTDLQVSLVTDKLSGLISGQRWTDVIVTALMKQLAAKTDAWAPKYNGEYQYDTSAHTIQVNDNPGQTGLTGFGLEHGGVGISASVKFEFYKPNPEQKVNPANDQKEWHYFAEGYWSLSVSGSVSGRWELTRPPNAKLDVWVE